MTTPALTIDSFDTSVRPQDDLFVHVNGGWLADATIPDDRSSWGSFHELREASEKAVFEIIDEIASSDDPADPRIAALYRSFMDTDAIAAVGTTPLDALLAEVDAISSTSELARWWGSAMRRGIGGLIGFGTDADPGDPGRYRFFVEQGGISLPDEEYYRLDEHASVREAFRAHLVAMFTLAGVDDPEGQADRTFNLETKIAACHWDKVRTRDMVQMYHPQPWADYAATAPDIDWDEFVAGAELPPAVLGTIINCQRTFAPDVAKLVTAESLDDWRAWARWQVMDSLASYLTDAFVDQNFDFYGRTLQGIPVLRQRWKRGVNLVENVLGEAVGAIYAERHFPADYKARVEVLVGNLLKAYEASITVLDWMSDETRAEALEKLSKFRPKIGYPNTWRDYSALQLSDDLVANVLAANSFEFDHMIEQASGPIDPDEWLMYPQTVNAYYHPLRNEIVFPAAMLQPPFFNPDADEAVNYGSIGAVIGHEIGHGFDDQGSTCDGDGRLRNWWTDEDRTAFTKRTSSLVQQYSALSPAAAPDVKVNGELTLGENIGDLGGLGIAYMAWRIALGDEQPDDADGYTPAQRFFLGWAQSWRNITRPEAMRERVATDPHSPDEIRCNQTARNVDAFHEAFGTTPDDAMWLDPEQRVRIW